MESDMNLVHLIGPNVIDIDQEDGGWLLDVGCRACSLHIV